MHNKRFDFTRLNERGEVVEQWNGSFAEFISLQDENVLVAFGDEGIAQMDEVMRTQPLYHALKWDKFKKTVIPAVRKAMKENR